jgi:general secretion pathway protein H
MPTSATGRCSSRPLAAPASIRGFTLVEILVVVVIIGILAVGVVLSLGTVGDDRELERERDRIVAITDYLREQATMQNREFGMRVFDGGYEFLAWDARTARWEQVLEDPLLRTRDLPPGLDTRLVVEGRPVILPKQDADTPAPQILLFSSGEVNSFELTLLRSIEGPAGARDGPAEVFAPDLERGGIAVRSVAAGAS